ncbi:MAG TPA: DegT/DnrJ/EryC1/StrS family aminotransferase [Solirubrobacterales bacterium]|nr:DegT/DnrJ/EryC1/StrS family aminotransferase [Solirubrobacterales bacterium]
MDPGTANDPIPVFDVRLEESHVEAVAATLRSGWLTMGPRIQEFEAEFAEHLGTPHAIAVSSCTSALHLAYLAAGIGPGDEVIVPGITFVASAAAVRYCGGTPVLAEIAGQGDLGLDPADVEARIGPRTKAICAVHYGGYAAPLGPLQEICDRHGLALIEDAAHSPEAVQPGGPEGKLGTFGLAGTFSFFSNKILSCGEGGLLATADDEVAELARSRRSHAMTTGTWDRHRGHALGYDVVEVGYNYRMDEPRAALLSARLPDLAADIAARRALTHRYRELLGEVEGLVLPYTDEQVDASSCYVMPVMLEDAELRDPVRKLLSENHKVQTSVLYPSISEFSAYGAGEDELPRCERAARTQLTLPLYPHLGEERLQRVVGALRQSLGDAAAA